MFLGASKSEVRRWLRGGVVESRHRKYAMVLAAMGEYDVCRVQGE